MSIGSFISSVGSTIKNTANNVATGVKEKVGDVKECVHDKVDDIKEKVDDIKEKVSDKVDDIKEKVDDAIAYIKENKQSIQDSIHFTDEATKLTKEANTYGDDSEVLMDQMSEDGLTENAVFVNGTDKADTIDITINKDGSYLVSMNGEETTYSSEEAQRLVVNGGDGDDKITVHQEAMDVGSQYALRYNTRESARRAASGILINAGAGNDTITASDDVKQKLYMTGGEGNDTITGGSGNDIITDNYGSNRIDGGEGNDTITAMGKTSDSWLGRVWGKIVGSDAGSNTIEGGLGNDTIVTGDGDDIITDKGGNNTIVTNGGDDHISTNANYRYDENSIYAGDGDDVISTGDSHDIIHGGKGNDIISSTGGQNELYGEDGNDSITGGKDRDYIEGGKGDDTISGGEGNDLIYGCKGNDAISGDEGDDFINAGKGDDSISGGAGNDSIFGGKGDDRINGGDGDDNLIGGWGADSINGGDGADKIRYTDGKYGNDVVSTDELDDAQLLNPIKVPVNFVTNPIAKEGFTDRINDDLDALASIEPGQELLSGIAETGKIVAFTYTPDDNGYALSLGNHGDMKADGTPDRGNSSLVSINPSYRNNYGNSKPWSETNSMIIMAHELSHAYNNATGTMDDTDFHHDTGERDWTGSRTVKGAEFQAVGLHDDWVARPNPYGMSENDYREYFRMGPRTSYLP